MDRNLRQPRIRRRIIRNKNYGPYGPREETQSPCNERLWANPKDSCWGRLPEVRYVIALWESTPLTPTATEMKQKLEPSESQGDFQLGNNSSNKEAPPKKVDGPLNDLEPYLRMVWKKHHIKPKRSKWIKTHAIEVRKGASRDGDQGHHESHRTMRSHLKE